MDTKLLEELYDLVEKNKHNQLVTSQSVGDERIKECSDELDKQKEELYCEYSGLPSVKSYEKK